MKLKFFRTNNPVQVDGEGMATSSFQVDVGGVTDIEATPMGTVIRRKEPLADLLITDGWGIPLKTASPVPANFQKQGPVQPAKVKR